MSVKEAKSEFIRAEKSLKSSDLVTVFKRKRLGAIKINGVRK